MKTVEIVIFIDHLEKEREIKGVFTTLDKADKFCMEFSKNNPEYNLKRNSKNKRHWIGDSYNYNLKIIKELVDKSI